MLGPQPLIAMRAIYLTADRQRAVPAHHDEAIFLLVQQGEIVPVRFVERYDLEAKEFTSRAVPEESDEAMPRRVKRRERTDG